MAERKGFQVGMYVIRDALSGYASSQIFQQYNDAVAMRTFQQMAMSDKPNGVNEAPNDRYLVRLGWFDLSSGEIQLDREEFGNAAQFVRVDSKTEGRRSRK